MSKAIHLDKIPEMKDATLIMAWPDTGHVGLRVVDHLRNKLGAQRFGRIEPYGFSLVPWVSVKDGVIRRLEVMKNDFYYWQGTGKQRDLVIYRSDQPTVKTYEYVDLVLDVAEKCGVRRLYTAGAFGATGITHSEKPVVLGVANQPELTDLLEKHDVKPYPEYKGVGNIHSSFLWFARQRNIDAISLWSPMPYYVARLPFPWSNYPKCSVAILEKLTQMEGIEVDLDEVKTSASQTDSEMGKIYEELYEQAKKEFVYPSLEQASPYTEDASEAISEDDVRRMMKDVEDFFKKGDGS